MNNSRIQTTELDFDRIKSNLKTFLQGQSEFSDYDFEGSGLSVLLDILAYNTHYNALYTNLAINEAFIDSAAKRSSVVSIAKELGYVPSSARAATANVSVTMVNSQLTAPTSIEIPAYTSFTSIVNNTTYTFYSTQSYLATLAEGQYVFPSVDLKEGTYLQYRYGYTDGIQIVIPNTGVDLSTLSVTVQENSQSSTYEVYTVSDSILNLTATSPVYFIKELDNQLYQLEFGNGVIGKQLAEGNVITISYLVCSADAPNGARTFSYQGTLPANTTAFVSTTNSAAGGAQPESTESIRWNAPRAYASQNRCVTVDDYKAQITSLFPEALAVSVWGGEENTPPQYGKVFVSVVPRTTDVLSDSQKSYILQNIINPRKPLTITPVIVDPIYVKLQLNISYYYNPQLTTRSSGDITTLVSQTVSSYNDAHLNAFGRVFKYSQLSNLVDTSEQSITSNIMTLKLHRDVTPVYNTVSGYTVNLGNPIYDSGVPEESVLSTGFYTPDGPDLNTPCYIDDIPTGGESAGKGDLRLFYYNSSGQKVILRTVGTVDYSKGIVYIEALNITSLYATSFKLIIKPESNDVASVQHQFVEIDPTLVTITPIVDNPALQYTFTSSRN